MKNSRTNWLILWAAKRKVGGMDENIKEKDFEECEVDEEVSESCVEDSSEATRN